MALLRLIIFSLIALLATQANAAASGDQDAIENRIPVVSDPDARETLTGPTSLHNAVRDRNWQAARGLLSAGANPNAIWPDYSGASALMLAAENNDLAMARLLIHRKADLNLTDDNGDTALNWAAYYGWDEFAEVLLEAGADPTVTGHGNALEIALRRGHQELVARLAGHMALLSDPAPEAVLLEKAVRADDATAVTAMLGDGVSPNLRDATNRPLISKAARNGHLRALRALLAGGGDPNATDAIGQTPLMEAARDGHVKLVASLLDAGADPRHVSHPSGLSLTALHMAAIGGDPAIVRLLAGAGAELERPDRLGNGPVMWAFVEQNFEALAVLLELGADANQTNQAGDSVASLAKVYGMTEVLDKIGD